MINTIQKQYKHWLIIALFIIFLPTYLAARDNNYSLDLLEEQLIHKTEDSLSSPDTLSKSNIFKTIIELDTQCIPILAKTINSTDRTRKVIAGIGLSIIGNDEALQTLKTSANQADDEVTLLQYMIALCGRGRPQDLSIVIKTIQENRSPFLTNSTAYHLAILHPEVFKENFHKFELREGNLKYFEQVMASSGQLSLLENDNIESQIISKVILSGIPRLFERNRYIDTENNNTWELHNNIWNCKTGINDSDRNKQISRRYEVANINFNTYISSNHTRAIVDVSLIFGGLNGSGFVYALKKINGQWEITYFSQTWIS